MEKGISHTRRQVLGFNEPPLGDRYKGQFRKDQRTGYGVMQFANGDRYEGEWLADKKHGRGKYTHSLTDDIYDGEWVNDQKTGKGQYVFGYE